MTNQLIKKAFKYDISCYFSIVIMATLFWAKNYSRYTRVKGDDFFFLAEYLLVLTLIFYAIQILFIRRLKYLILLLVPFLTIITSIILGLGVFTISSMGGTPSQTIYVYSIIYCLTNILFSFYTLSSLTKTGRTFDEHSTSN